MSSETIVILKDDLDGSEAAETVKFGYQGRSYTIDLNAKNAAALDKALEKFIAVATEVRGQTRTVRGRKSAGSSSAGELAQIREWARANGYQVSDRGRIAANIVEAYNAK